MSLNDHTVYLNRVWSLDVGLAILKLHPSLNSTWYLTMYSSPSLSVFSFNASTPGKYRFRFGQRLTIWTGFQQSHSLPPNRVTEMVSLLSKDTCIFLKCPQDTIKKRIFHYKIKPSSLRVSCGEHYYY